MATRRSRRVTAVMEGIHFTVKLDGVTVFDQDLPDAPTEAGFAGLNMRHSWDALGKWSGWGSWANEHALDNVRIARSPQPTDLRSCMTH